MILHLISSKISILLPYMFCLERLNELRLNRKNLDDYIEGILLINLSPVAIQMTVLRQQADNALHC